MSKTYWRTTFRWDQRKEAPWPSRRQIIRQLGIGALILAFWGIAFAAFLRITTEPEPGRVAIPSVPTREPTASADAVAVSSATPTLAVTSVRVPTLATATPTPLANTATVEAAETTAEPSAAPSDTPRPEATATSTALPPTSSPTPLPALARTIESSQQELVSFSEDVLPILQNRCVKCHGGERTEEGLILTTYADVLAGSWNGSVIEPGDAEGSYLVEQIISGDMPKRAPRLLPAEIRFITEWINAGAPDN